MKNRIVCLLAIVFTAISYGQGVEVKKELTAQEKIATLSSEFKFSPEQKTFLEKYLTLDKALKGQDATKESIASKQLKMERQLVELFPSKVVTEIRRLNKKDPKNLTKKDIGM
jgi:cell division protein FtsL